MMAAQDRRILAEFTSKVCERLKKQRIVSRIGPAKGGYWEVVKG